MTSPERSSKPTLAALLLDELEREAAGTRHALERVPEGKDDWKPHEKSMELGYLAALVAVMPSWVKSIVTEDSLDLAAPNEYQTRALGSKAALLEAFDKAMAAAREALENATDEHLLTTSWQMKVQGQVVLEETRYVALRVSVINHYAHHRGQLTVYLRLNEVPVPSLYGPSADEKTF